MSRWEDKWYWKLTPWDRYWAKLSYAERRRISPLIVMSGVCLFLAIKHWWPF